VHWQHWQERPGRPLMRAEANSTEELYLDLLKLCLTRTGFESTFAQVSGRSGLGGLAYRALGGLLSARGIELVRRVDQNARAEGRVWLQDGETMIGLHRLNNLQECITDIIRHHIPGDLIETGVWRGGACIFMRAVLKAYEDSSRSVWVADSFQGLPPPNPERYPADAGDRLFEEPALRVSVEEVQANFRKYGLLDDRVRFLVGWFRDTLPIAPIDQLALVRLDGDLYESTMDALRSLYPKLSVGGYLIVDDYALPGCRLAVDEFRREFGISDDIKGIDWTGVFWRKGK
jgi:O-methyltransferase